VKAEVTIRPALRSDATALAQLFAAQREHLAPWDPRREPAFFTRAGQRARLVQVERERAAGTSHRFLILATAAVAAACVFAFDELELHRLEAGTLLHNAASQIVLDRNGFRPFGVAQRYLRIAGSWCDHVLFQRTSEQPARPLGRAALARRITLLADPQ
jgi:ribosomal-protein-alanine N-acetyltransferase